MNLPVNPGYAPMEARAEPLVGQAFKRVWLAIEPKLVVETPVPEQRR